MSVSGAGSSKPTTARRSNLPTISGNEILQRPFARLPQSAQRKGRIDPLAASSPSPQGGQKPSQNSRSDALGHKRASSIVNQFPQPPAKSAAKPLSDAESDFEDAESDINETDAFLVHSQRAEIQKLRREMTNLKEHNERLLRSEVFQAEKMRELKRTNEDDRLLSKTLESEITKLKSVYTRISEHLQCHICLELLKLPYTLSPCGHVACFECLLQWFLATDPDEDPLYPIAPVDREKTCPQCRAFVEMEPAPSYTMKQLVDEILPLHPDQASEHPVDHVHKPDAWKGIFPPPQYEDASTDDDDEEEDSDEDSDEDDLSSQRLLSDSDEDGISDSSRYRAEYHARREHLDQVMTWEIDMRNEATEWMLPTWAPPRFDSGAFDVSLADMNRLALPRAEIISLLRRGATKEMIERFQLRYYRHQGIVVQSRSGRIRLGWNISRNVSDQDGSLYMRSVSDELREHRERYRVLGAETLGSENVPTLVRLMPNVRRMQLVDEDAAESDMGWRSEPEELEDSDE